MQRKELHRPQEGAKTRVGPGGWTGRRVLQAEDCVPQQAQHILGAHPAPSNTPAHGPSGIGALLPSGCHRAHLSGESLQAEACRMNGNFHIKWMA